MISDLRQNEVKHHFVVGNHQDRLSIGFDTIRTGDEWTRKLAGQTSYFVSKYFLKPFEKNNAGTADLNELQPFDETLLSCYRI